MRESTNHKCSICGTCDSYNASDVVRSTQSQSQQKYLIHVFGFFCYPQSDISQLTYNGTTPNFTVTTIFRNAQLSTSTKMQWTLFSELCVLMLKHANRPDITYLGHSENHIVIDLNLNLVMHSCIRRVFLYLPEILLLFICVLV